MDRDLSVVFQKRGLSISRLRGPPTQTRRALTVMIPFFNEAGNIQPLIEFDTALENAVWDEPRQLWVLDTTRGQYLARTVIFATGPITESQTPKLPGLDSFTGEMFHSARWNHDYDLTGKRVAVIGTGASAIQFVPEIQPKVKSLFVFQRTAPWLRRSCSIFLNWLSA